MLKKVSTTIIVTIIILLIINLVRQISQALGESSRLDNDINEVNTLQQENNALKQKLNQVQTFSYLEQISRNELDFSQPNETVVVIPENVLNKVLYPPKPPAPKVLPNWQLWLKLIFHI